MSKRIATIKLAPGNVGFFDELTRIHLTLSSPMAEVFEGMNTTNLKKGVRYKTIEVIDGSLVVTIDEDSEIDSKIANIKKECNEYTDGKIESAKIEVKEDSKSKADSAKETAVNESRSYADTKLEEAKAYTDEKVSEEPVMASTMSLEEDENEVKEEKVVKRGRPKKSTSSTEEEA